MNQKKTRPLDRALLFIEPATPKPIPFKDLDKEKHHLTICSAKDLLYQSWHLGLEPTCLQYFLILALLGFFSLGSRDIIIHVKETRKLCKKMQGRCLYPIHS